MEIKIMPDIEKVFSNIDLAKLNTVMSAGKEGVQFSEWLARSFKSEN